MLIQTRPFRIAREIPLVGAFLQGLANFRVSISERGRNNHAAVSGHDDLMLAVAIALWYAEALSEVPKFEPLSGPINVFRRECATPRRSRMTLRGAAVLHQIFAQTAYALTLQE